MLEKYYYLNNKSIQIYNKYLLQLVYVLKTLRSVYV